MMIQRILLFTLFVNSKILGAVADTCYFPNGNTVPGAQICGGSSMCCQNSQQCLPNGLCVLNAPTDQPDGTASSQYASWACTDNTWVSPPCLKNPCGLMSVSVPLHDSLRKYYRNEEPQASQCIISLTPVMSGETISHTRRLVLAFCLPISSWMLICGLYRRTCSLHPVTAMEHLLSGAVE